MTQRFDNWSNALSGLGHSLRDKVLQTQYTPDAVLSDARLEDLYHGDDMAARVCDLIPDEMLRQGFQIQCEDADLANDLSKQLEQLGAREKLNEALVWARVLGGSALFIGADDGQNPALPLNLHQTRQIRFLTVLDKRELSPLKSYTDPLYAQFAQTEIYRVDQAEIHESRLLVFQGTRTSKRRRQQNGGWSYSVLQRLYDVMRQFNLSWQATAHLLSDSAQAVFKLKGLHAQIAANKTSDILQRMELVDMSRSVARAVLLDAEDEDFKRDSYSFSGVPELLDKFMLRLAAAARMPVSLLMGQAPARLNATGDSDIRFFYDQVKAEQEHTLKPQLKRLVQVLLATYPGQRAGEGFDVTFPALWQETELEKAQLRKLQSEIDATYIQNQVLLPEEVALNRFSAKGFKFETLVELADRHAILNADREAAREPSSNPEPQ